jgi:hypothetical protein
MLSKAGTSHPIMLFFVAMLIVTPVLHVVLSWSFNYLLKELDKIDFISSYLDNLDEDTINTMYAIWTWAPIVIIFGGLLFLFVEARNPTGVRE